ncbi:hypothetical protein BV25DRAFT_25525 [Artomyces pyxidatus]|uniref:Uncharacterized protein n=1 Tax=Artomyces pyxidatus TaxID=48021 RepID=A0ACB8TJV6_9AGAM|nr:hypothetical protein BV25DRAFT_25525 [Artomyces pyxidatus]
MQTPVRVIVRLPYNRPEQAPPDPVPVEWNVEKENYLWEVIARSRAADNGTPDWKALASRLGVPLPYLLYRAQTRYEQDLRGLQDIRGALDPSGAGRPQLPDDPLSPTDRDRPGLLRKDSGRLSSLARLSSSARLTTPLGVRARLNSLSNASARMSRPSSSSVLTLRGAHRKDHAPFKPTSPLSSESESDDDAAREEEADRRAEEQEALDSKLRALERLMTGDTLGLVSSVREERRDSGKGKSPLVRGRNRSRSPPRGGLQRSDVNVLSRSHSQSISSASSPQGSIPSMPSPPPEARSQHLSPDDKAGSTTAVSQGHARGQHHKRYPVSVRQKASEMGSHTGSSASSFSDLSEASLSGSALESALLSNIRGNGSRLSNFARSHLIGKGGGSRH